MNGLLGHGERERQLKRRLLAVVGALLLLGGQALSALFLIHEADHACGGDECPICAEMWQCAANLQLAGSGLTASPAARLLPVAIAGLAPFVAATPIAITLVSLKVRLND
ncbi:MAG: hypothetical protein J6333_09310 [Planctomycetes bacterium]|nr:hypothetical protein [Planctomycetota bacterium]